jgi:hypothetical protein
LVRKIEETGFVLDEFRNAGGKGDFGFQVAFFTPSGKLRDCFYPRAPTLEQMVVQRIGKPK